MGKLIYLVGITCLVGITFIISLSSTSKADMSICHTEECREYGLKVGTLDNRSTAYSIIQDIEKQSSTRETFFYKEELKSCTVSKVESMLCILFNIDKLYDQYYLRYFYYKHNTRFGFWGGFNKVNHKKFNNEVKLIQKDIINHYKEQIESEYDIYPIKFMENNNYALIKIKLSDSTLKKNGPCFYPEGEIVRYSQEAPIEIVLERIGINLYSLVYIDLCGLDNEPVIYY